MDTPTAGERGAPSRIEPGPGGRRWRRVNDVVAGLGATWLISLAMAIVHPKPLIAGLLLLVVVLGVAVWRGLLAGTVASVSGVWLLNYYFIPPVGWTIEEPEDLVALVCFLVTSTLASRLVVVARNRAIESEARGREVRVLYDLSVELFGTSGRQDLPAALGRAFQRLGASGGALLIVGKEPLFASFGERPPDAEDPRLLHALGTGTPVVGTGDLDLPLSVEGRTAGVLSVRGTTAARQAVESAARLVALALERERLLGERLHLEALRESDALKTSLLRAVSHDLRTPLTAIRLKIETLRRILPSLPQGMEALGTMTREVENLKHRIDNLLSMARLQAGMSVPRPEPSPAADLFRAALNGLASVLEGREVHVVVAEECPDVFVDPSLAVEILINLLENAAHAAPADTPLELRAEPSSGEVRLAILDRGPGLPRSVGDVATGERAPAPETSGVVRRGLGLEIARGLAAASGGRVGFEARAGGGTIAFVFLPASQSAEEAYVRTA